ncbi:hypothetical protein HN51_028464 [Arachis hypogaea]|uniref:FAD dependent oxidoreductase domain-containing protein n=1 Tax=Arachis hypogaea TaxID=3818 RepID=A0A445BJ08_ARAHY|nr:probable sarcosine oxidase [Arachis hypogaea]QHO34959.1 putative sarcosine oxidase [Arachis hypogaea]RYR38591.1 hypothetical protein Ahy_A09g043656 [Arachis hypogaea]
MQNVSNDLFDVIIVGGGVMGSATAYHASKRGLKTLLIEQFDFLHHRGSSHGESRTIRANYSKPYYYPLVMESYTLWKQAQAQIGYNVYFPAHQLDMGQAHDHTLLKILENCSNHGIPHEVLNRCQLADKFSGRIDFPDDSIGILNEFGGVIKATKAVAMFQTLAHKNGAVLKDNKEITDIKKDERGVVVVSASNNETFCGKKCVVTVGAWMSKLVKKVSGVEIPIKPVEIHVFYWRVKEGHEGDFAIGGDFPTFSSHGGLHVFGTPSLEYPGLVKIVVDSGDKCDPDKREWGPGVRMNELKEWIKESFNGLIDWREPVVKQACMYSMTPDNDYVVDFLGGQFGKDVVVGGGFSGHGFKMAPVIGRILAELAVDGVPSGGTDISPFGIGRFNSSQK